MPRAWGRNPAAAVRDPAPLLPGWEGGGGGWVKTLRNAEKPPTPKCKRFFVHVMGMSISEMPGATLPRYGITAHPGCQGKNHAAKRPVKPLRLYGARRCDKIWQSGARRSRQSAARQAARAQKSPGARSAKRRRAAPTRPGAGAATPEARRAGQGGTRRPAHGEQAQPAAKQGRPTEARRQARASQRAARGASARRSAKARRAAERRSRGAWPGG